MALVSKIASAVCCSDRTALLEPSPSVCWMGKYSSERDPGDSSARGSIPRHWYTWLMSPEPEQLLCDALVHLGPVETEQGLHAEGVRKIQEVLHCTLADARTTLRELRVRKRIEETTTPVEQLTKPHFRWVQPSV